MEVKTWSFKNALGEEQEVTEFRIKNGDGQERYVEVDALLHAFAEVPLDFLKVEEVINKAPTTDVAPVVHGTWIDSTDETFSPSHKCSRCGHIINELATDDINATEIDRENYCPNCGARMDLQ